MGRHFGIEKEYSKDEIFAVLDKLKISQEGLNVLTHYDGKLIANTQVSKIYEVFDFPTFAKEVVSEIEKYFTPEKYKLRITKGAQELRLIGEDVLINDDVYQKMFNIINSTDKSRALSLSAGLMRMVCTNGLVVGVEDEFEQVRVKHYKTKLPDKVVKFIEGLSNFDISINKQAETISNIVGKSVSFKDIIKGMAFNKDGLVTSTTSLRMRAFCKKIQSSQSDAIKGLSVEQINLLNNVHIMVSEKEKFDKEPTDIVMDAYKALNLYTEIYRNYDSTVLKRETNRIFDLLK